MRVLLAKQAEVDFDVITEGLASLNLKAASTLTERFRQKFTSLEQFPELGARLVNKPSLRMTFVTPYVLYYLIYEDHVEIVRILHGARDHGPLLDDE
jgi:toxin ParE1/3/4